MCRGFRGALTVMDSSSERFYVVGIVSIGMGCGRQEYPGVYTRVFNRIIFHFPVSEGHNRVDNRIAKVAKIIG